MAKFGFFVYLKKSLLLFIVIFFNLSNFFRFTFKVNSTFIKVKRRMVKYHKTALYRRHDIFIKLAKA